MLLGETNDSSGIFVWSLILIVLVIAGFVLVSYFRRRLKEPDQPVATGFTLGDLRDMHRRGQLTDEEFERARAQIVASAKAAMARQESPKDKPRA